ncbi:RNA deprotection pyrophosphohydrolase [Lederbergia lenta]|uniref:Nucleoside triphosphatase YtkD n=1 Tax=Lederbergia lenta TaxID=1467 RepID=A0A2X4W9M5_LEDLE|nr:nucleoside triphosphatase YtkD [Lederbergia lenta]MCM3113430.1 nucleoside triphosphatase YtkD [Lederbergia lenta]MEC2326425.1 nucleoside triphosphatase YtkD [Lederbergia lenta]SQI61357.1 nucleoside triphosphatase YtkD [Lederbergia lenta]
MKEFYDIYNNKVFLTFNTSFQIEACHVLVICRYQDRWLLTKHSKRGLEFPGGKRESGETIEEAARREVAEETGGIVRTIMYLGEYLVEDKLSRPFVKAIYYAEISSLEAKDDYLETNGPVLIGADLISRLHQPEYSFIMKDEVIPAAISKIVELGLYK